MTADALLASLGITSTTGGPIFKFSCACGHTWQGRKASAGAYFERFASTCSGCGSIVTEAMEAAAEPLGVERCDCGVILVDGRCSVCVPSPTEAKARRMVPPAYTCARCGGSHPLVEHYGAEVCPVLAPKTAAVDAEIDAEVTAARKSCFCGKDHRPVAAYGAWCCPDRLSGARFGDLQANPPQRVLGLEVADSREIDKLRDLRALVLRTGHPTGKAWGAIITAARAAMTPATFDPGPAAPAARDSVEEVLRAVWEHWAGGDVPPALETRIRAVLGLEACELITGADGTMLKVTGSAKWRSLGLSITTTLPTEEHECSSCHRVTHTSVGMGPPATCPGCGR